MTLQSKFTAGFAVMIVLLLIQGAFSGFLFHESRDLGETVKQKDLPLVFESMELRELLYQTEGALNGWVLSADEKFKRQHQKLWEEIQGHVQRIGDVVVSENTMALQVLQDEVIALAHTMEARPATRQMELVIKPKALEIQDATRRLLFYERRRAQGKVSVVEIKQSKFLMYSLSNFQRSFSEIVSLLDRMLLSGALEGEGQATLTTRWRQNQGAWVALTRSDITDRQKIEMDRIKKVRDQFFVDATEMIRLRTTDQWDLAAWKVSHQVSPAVEESIALVTALADARVKKMNLGFTNQSKMMMEGSRLVWIFVFVALVVTMITKRELMKRIQAPIRKVLQIFHDIREKNYHTPIEAQEKDEMGELLSALGEVRDQLLHAELDEQSSRAALQNQKFALDQAAIVSGTDLDGNINYINQRMLDLSGYKEEELMGQNHRLIKSGEHDEAFYQNMWKTVSSGLVWRGEVCNRTRAGKRVWMDTTIVPFLGEDLLPVQYMAIRHDITLMKETGQRIQEEQKKTVAANQELQQSMQQLQEAQHQLVEAEKMASLGGLVAGVAHEVNTPLGISVTAASYLSDRTQKIVEQYQQQKMKRSDLDQYLKTAEESASIVLKNLDRAAALVRSFKQVAVDQSSEEVRSFELVAYLQDILRSLQPKLKRLPHEVKISGDEKVTIKSDPGAFSQVVTNLVMNSMIHGFGDEAEQGTVTMEVVAEAHGVLLRYQDDGKGASQEVVSKIFEPFFTTRRGEGGSGLGMHLVYNLVTQKMGGTIRCQSAPGEGMLFEIHLPETISNRQPESLENTE